MRKNRRRGSKLGKFENMYFLNHPIPISSIADEFISRGLIFAKSPKIREIVKFYPRKN